MPPPDVARRQHTPAGTPVHADFRKYDGTEHWQEPYRLLGVDQHGVWLAMPAGTRFGRPGRAMTAPSDGVRLIPHTTATRTRSGVRSTSDFPPRT